MEYCVVCGEPANIVNLVTDSRGNTYTFRYCSSRHEDMHYPFDCHGCIIPDRVNAIGLTGVFDSPTEGTDNATAM